MCGVSPAAAQFTTAIPPRPRAEREAIAVLRSDSVRRDTTVAQRLSGIKTWVDSAAVALNVKTPGSAPAGSRDTMARDTTVARDMTVVAGRVTQQAAAGEVTRFREGAPAPDTATLLPALALLGVGTLLAGAWLLRR